MRTNLSTNPCTHAVVEVQRCDAERPPRPLTSDETKAAEAAFTGCPFQPGWSEAAWHVYEAIRLVLMTQGRSQIDGFGKF